MMEDYWDPYGEPPEDDPDELPDTENLADDWDNLPPLADALITGGVAQGPQDAIGRPPARRARALL